MEEAWPLDGIIQRSRLIRRSRRRAKKEFESESLIVQRLTVGSGDEKSKRENPGDVFWAVDLHIRSMIEMLLLMRRSLVIMWASLVSDRRPMSGLRSDGTH